MSSTLRNVTYSSLADLWRARAQMLELYSAAAAGAYRTAATELENAEHEVADRQLTLEEAAKVSGYSRDHLARLIRAGKLPNAGKRHAPRIRAGDLPTRPRRPPGRVQPNGYDPIADARSLCGRQGA